MSGIPVSDVSAMIVMKMIMIMMMNITVPQAVPASTVTAHVCHTS